MTDHTTRDEIRAEILHAMSSDENIDNEGDLDYGRAADSIFAALVAAGLVVPAGLTAEKLRDLAEMVDSGYIADQDVVDEIREWADVLELRETP